MKVSFRRFIVCALLLLGIGAHLWTPIGTTVGTPAHATTRHHTRAATRSTITANMFAYYYLWWSKLHWHDKLGSSFPYASDPLPLPATLDSSGCNPRSKYSGNELTDAPRALFTQDRRATIEHDVRSAAKAGLRGFIVNWAGTGHADQTTKELSYSRRLRMVVDVVHEVNKDGIKFKLWISYKASDTILTTNHIAGDLAYLRRTYAHDAAFDRTFSKRLPLVWMGSRKYPTSVLSTISKKFRPSFYLIGDENWDTWTSARGAVLDGDQYYWSSQDPYRNPASFTQIKHLAAKVRNSKGNPDGSKKMWFAPIAPGFNTILLGGSTCVPRKDGATLRKLFAGNKASHPNGWVLISWNEIAEGTYVQPLRRYGSHYLNVISDLVH
jgi:hypothetical protein